MTQKTSLSSLAVALSALSGAQTSFVADAQAAVNGPGGYSSKQDNQGKTTASISAAAPSGSASASSWGSMLSTHAYA